MTSGALAVSCSPAGPGFRPGFGDAIKKAKAQQAGLDFWATRWLVQEPDQSTYIDPVVKLAKDSWR
jgi:hypothetical protein